MKAELEEAEGNASIEDHDKDWVWVRDIKLIAISIIIIGKLKLSFIRNVLSKLNT